MYECLYKGILMQYAGSQALEDDLYSTVVTLIDLKRARILGTARTMKEHQTIEEAAGHSLKIGARIINDNWNL